MSGPNIEFEMSACGSKACSRWRLQVYISVFGVLASNGSAFTAGYLEQRQVTKRFLPHHSAPRLGSVCPNAGIAPRVAAMGHPWPSAAKPASLPVSPLRNACVRPAWLMGVRDQQPRRGGLRADQGIKLARCACFVYTCPCRSRLAGDGGVSAENVSTAATPTVARIRCGNRRYSMRCLSNACRVIAR